MVALCSSHCTTRRLQTSRRIYARASTVPSSLAIRAAQKPSNSDLLPPFVPPCCPEVSSSTSCTADTDTLQVSRRCSSAEPVTLLRTKIYTHSQSFLQSVLSPSPTLRTSRSRLPSRPIPSHCRNKGHFPDRRPFLTPAHQLKSSTQSSPPPTNWRHAECNISAQQQQPAEGQLPPETTEVDPNSSPHRPKLAPKRGQRGPPHASHSKRS